MNEETEFADFTDRCLDAAPSVFVVLGSGLGAIVDRVKPITAISFAAIPGLPASTIAGHRGRWLLGRWARRTVLVSEGRVHFYEGNTWDVVALPIRLAATLGVRVALLTNAAGGIRRDLVPGTLMPLRDHLEWNRPYPWREAGRPSPYLRTLVEGVCRAGKDVGLDLTPGVYAAVTGPSYETPAEIRALRSMNADAVGMSTSREAIAGAEAGLACAAISLITNRAAGLSEGPLDHQEVLAAGKATATRLGELIERFLVRLG